VTIRYESLLISIENGKLTLTCTKHKIRNIEFGVLLSSIAG
jgi:glycerol-3-phosphate dehydrogenase